MLEGMTTQVPNAGLVPPPMPAPIVPAGDEDLERQPVMEVRGLGLSYAGVPALHAVSMPVFQSSVTAIIGPSGCGKSSLLRCLNRMNDLIPGARVTGQVMLGGLDVYAPAVNANRLRRRVGMVFQKSNPFPKSVYDNVAYGIRLHGLARDRGEVEGLVEASLRQVGLWDEVKDRLRQSALNLSGGQQQRLCVARTIAVRPKIILMDEPASSLDPIATGRIEELIQELKSRFTIVLVTHNLHQAGRCSDYTAFLYMGHLIEFDTTQRVFTAPSDRYTEAFISGRFG
jgi:phosphate transport system ATP-binding protein